MFKRLQQKWKVNGWQLVFIISTFAIAGSLTGYAAKKLMNILSIDQAAIWIIIYILFIIFLWPLMVLLVSIPFGQLDFFLTYIRKIGTRLGLVKLISKGSLRKSRKSEIRIALFASGAGSNAQKIIDHFRNHSFIKISMIVCNNPEAGVLKIAANESIPSFIIEKENFFRGNGYTEELKKNKIDFIVLAGFLWKLPPSLLQVFPDKIINIHPALLPKYGGKGMYGNKVHEAVLANKEKESGISIHFVDYLYDHGKIIFQAKCPVMENDTVDSLAKRIHSLEHQYYPEIIESIAGKTQLIETN